MSDFYELIDESTRGSIHWDHERKISSVIVTFPENITLSESSTTPKGATTNVLDRWKEKRRVIKQAQEERETQEGNPAPGTTKGRVEPKD